jgi:hypothetical protein
MKSFLIAAAVVAVTATNPARADDAGVSVSIGQADFYGRLDIGGFPQPQLIYRQPMVIQRGTINGPPIYLHVPPSHARHWGRHCGEYNACGERVFFVQDNWYKRQYVPRYAEQHGVRQDERRDGRRDENRGNSRNAHRVNEQGHARDH